MMFALLSIACFIAAFVLDAVEAVYVRAVADAKPRLAAVCSVSMYAIGCVGFFSVLSFSWWLMLPEVAGLYCGSVYAIRRQARARVA